jgi:hypothetical protein
MNIQRADITPLTSGVCKSTYEKSAADVQTIQKAISLMKNAE